MALFCLIFIPNVSVFSLAENEICGEILLIRSLDNAFPFLGDGATRYLNSCSD